MICNVYDDNIHSQDLPTKQVQKELLTAKAGGGGGPGGGGGGGAGIFHFSL